MTTRTLILNTAAKVMTADERSVYLLYNRRWSKSERDKLSKEAPGDFAGPHQSFPIKTQEDVNSAAKLIGHADDPEKVKSKIKSIAKRKGLKIPKSWEGASNASSLGSKTLEGSKPSYNTDDTPNNQIDSDDETVNGSVSDDETVNAWTAVARQASLASRRGKAGNSVVITKPVLKGKKQKRKGGFHQKFKRNSNSEGVMDKEEMVAWLTTNCSCWKGVDNAEETLNSLSEEQLKGLKTNAEKARYTEIATTIVKNTGKAVGFKGNFNELPTFVANSLKTNAKGKKGKPKSNPMDDDEDDDETNNATTGLESDSEIFSDSGTSFTEPSPGMEDFEPIGTKGTRPNGGVQSTQGNLIKGGGYQLPSSGQLGVMNAIRNALSQLTPEQFKEVLPAGTREVLNTAEEVHTREKVAIINKLTTHIGDPKQRKQKILHLYKKSMPALKELLEYSVLNNAQQQQDHRSDDERILANFFGQNGAPPSPAGQPVINSKDVLLPFLDPMETVSDVG